MSVAEGRALLPAVRADDPDTAVLVGYEERRRIADAYAAMGRTAMVVVVAGLAARLR
jgi:hypothetical protein